MKTVNWKAILIFYALAVAISAPFRLHLVPQLGSYQNYIGALGPLLASIICLIIFSKTHIRLNTIFGTSVKWSLIFSIIPFIGFIIIGFPDNIGKALYACGYVFLYCLMEEMGWRGFLQDALEPLKPARRYLLIGILWELWHLRFLSPDLSIGFKLVLLSSTIGGSFGIGKITETTRSILTAAWIHMLFNIYFEMDIQQPYKITLMIYLLIVWAIIFMIWLKIENKKRHSEEQGILTES